jgi:RNA recognition motif-containing protein
MGKKLFIGNLAFTVTEASLESAFAQSGTVESARIITDRDTGRSKGFAFVEMSTDDEAATAIRQLNGSDLDGRALNVSEARPQAPRDNNSRGGGGGGGYGGGGGGNRGGGGGGFGGGGRRY